jgi:hypothetical protein
VHGSPEAAQRQVVGGLGHLVEAPGCSGREQGGEVVEAAAATVPRQGPIDVGDGRPFGPSAQAGQVGGLEGCCS